MSKKSVHYRECFSEFFESEFNYLSFLDDRDRVVLCLRYCLDGKYGGTRTLKQVCDIAEINPQSIKYIMKKIFQILTHSSRDEVIEKIPNPILYDDILSYN